MKMRNWLKTTLALGMVVATGSVLVGCSGGETITYKAGVDALNAAVDTTTGEMAESKKAATDAKGFSITFKISSNDYEANSKSSTSMQIITSGEGDAAVTQLIASSNSSSSGIVSGSSSFKYDVSVAKVGDQVYCYNTSSKQVYELGIGQNLGKQVLDFDAASGFVSYLAGMILEGIGTEMAKVDANAEDPVSAYNTEYDKDPAEKTEGATRSSISTNFVKKGENSFDLTYTVTKTTWAAKADKENEFDEVNDVMKVNYVIENKVVKKIVADFSETKAGKKVSDGSMEVALAYTDKKLTAPTKETIDTYKKVSGENIQMISFLGD